MGQGILDHAAVQVAGMELRAITPDFILNAAGDNAQGVRAGDPIAIMAPTRYEWAVADLASWFAGAVVVPIYETS